MPSYKRVKRIFLFLAVLAVLAAGLLALAVEHVDIPPRRLGPYIEHRALGHNPAIERFGKWIGDMLVGLDRGESRPFRLEALMLGARAAQPVPAPVSGQVIMVNSTEQAARAITEAHPGEIITFLPGTYRFKGQALAAGRPGTRDKPITVRADRPGSVVLEFNMVEGFRVSAPHWTFENLTIRGVCAAHSDCEHAFHVVSRAAHFVARNNVIADFNAHFKVNGDGTFMPDHGVIEANTIVNSGVRQTAKPVTPIDIVAASGWIIERNLIADFIKGQGDRISYGAFAKGAGADNRFERNIVLCEHKLRGVPGQRVGLSIGGGGTGREFCRDKRCITEQEGGIIQSNLIAFCSDEGIYVNRGARSRILHNTLLDTAGVMVRFPESSADVEGNLVDGTIRSGHDSVLRADDNVTGGMMRLYLGWHPVRTLFRQADDLDLAWSSQAPRRNAVADGVPDLCGGTRPSQPAYGAFEDFAACLGSSAAAAVR